MPYGEIRFVRRRHLVFYTKILAVCQPQRFGHFKYLHISQSAYGLTYTTKGGSRNSLVNLALDSNC
ncbi:hypothetical protein BLOT_007022 [Blomia tropicalis]|nr:hypothetical protein BLOT_007022 [Blomia tropicalis]